VNKRDHFFLAYLPADSLKKGRNEITVYGLIPDDGSNSINLLGFEKK
jgi:hypothetical protein